MLLILVFACTGSGANKGPGSGDSLDSDPGVHPNVPEGYEDKWDVTSETCEKTSDSKIYYLGEASSDSEGNFTATETWYLFHGGDWEDDDVDVLKYEGTAMTRSDLNSLEATEAEEGYQTVRTVEQWDSNTNWSDDADRLLVFDTLTPSGNLNWENAMLVFMYKPSDTGGWRSDVNYARGVFSPDGDVLGPPAHYTWEGDDCW
jgi:hypothetical protein